MADCQNDRFLVKRKIYFVDCGGGKRGAGGKVGGSVEEGQFL